MSFKKMLALTAVAAGLMSSLPAQAVDAAKTSPAEIAPRAQHSLLTKVMRVGDRLLAVGSRGHILLSSDGKEWQQVKVPVNVLLTSAFFIDAKQGWVVGHDATVLHTTDGGQNWTLQHFNAEKNEPLLDVLFLDAQHGFAVGAYGLFLETRDAGTTWAPLASPVAEAAVHLNSIVRLADGALLIVGETGMIGFSEDQGVTWTKLPTPYDSSLFAALPYGEKGALIGGLRGNLYRTDDVRGGQWTKVETGTVQSIFGLADLGEGRTGLAGLNANLMVVNADNSVRKIPLRQPSAKNEMTTQELGAFSNLTAWKDGVLTVGEAGIHFWSLKP